MLWGAVVVEVSRSEAHHPRSQPQSHRYYGSKRGVEAETWYKPLLT